MATTLFMPDITGFTRFVKSTEQEHSRHIINDLIKLIIETGKSKFDVAEIEGDAVFFFKENKKYSVEEMRDISAKIYVRFHNHLQQYEHKRICECGACTSAANLELKFVVHSGEITMLSYDKSSDKPFGEPVIEVHRLLKNKVGHKEYILFSNKFLDGMDLTEGSRGEYLDQELGVIPYRFQLIADWKKTFKEDKVNPEDFKADLVIQKEYQVDLSPGLLHEMLINFKYRHLWNKGVDRIIYDQEKINQAGTEHYCVIKGKELSFDTTKPNVSSDKLAYGEILKMPAPFEYFESDFFLEEGFTKDTTHLKIEMKAKYRSKYQQILAPAFRLFLNRKAKESGSSIADAVPKFLELKNQSN